jgi:hypothetical protein
MHEWRQATRIATRLDSSRPPRLVTEPVSSIPCALIRVKCDGSAPTPCSRCIESQLSCSYRPAQSRRNSHDSPPSRAPAVRLDARRRLRPAFGGN